ncbi:hypothetical protein GQ457_08G023950 [Hibiscus cannabinus]
MRIEQHLIIFGLHFVIQLPMNKLSGALKIILVLMSMVVISPFLCRFRLLQRERSRELDAALHSSYSLSSYLDSSFSRFGQKTYS